jgi:anti-sigma factor RsiW
VSVACRFARVQMPLVDVDDTFPGPLTAHVSSCLRCQAESARYRSLRRNLAGLTSRLEPAPAGLAGQVSARITASESVPDVLRSRPPRVAAATGVVVAVAGTLAMVRWLRTRTAS